MRKKRHSPGEIKAKLEEAGEMSARGALQSEIARTLGISVMTYHRWRKARPPLGSNGAATTVMRDIVDLTAGDQIERMSALQLENARLRRLVTDLLLEKVKLDELLQASGTIGNPAKLTGR